MKRMKRVLFILLLGASQVGAQNLDQGIKHLELEQYERAKNIFKNIIKADSKNAQAYYYLGETYLKTDLPDSAKILFAEGIKNNEVAPLNFVGMGKVTFEDNPTEGKRNFDKALELSKSKDSKVLDYIAEYYITANKKDLPQAITLLERAVKVDGKNPEPYLLLGDVYLEKGDGGKAKSYYDQALGLNKNLPTAYLKIGKIYSRARNLNEGLKYFNEGLKIDPNYPPFYREIGELYYKVKQYPKAIENYKKYVDMVDKSFNTDFRFGSFLFFNNDYKGAIEVLDKLSAKDHNNPYLNRLLAYSYYETGNYEKGLANFDSFWKKADEKKYITSDYEYYGKLLSKTGKDSLAVLSFKKAIERDTANFALHGEIGNLYFAKKKYKDAANEYNLKLSKIPATAQDYLTLGKIYYFDKQYEKADTVFAKLIEIAPTSPNGYLWRGRANAQLDPEIKKGIAAPYYEKYIELVKGEPEKYKKELAEAYKQVGGYYMSFKKDKPKADEIWVKVKEFDPTFKEADEYLKAKY
jgi:tetratricopeptide (TPR) repeat protein